MQYPMQRFLTADGQEIYLISVNHGLGWEMSGNTHDHPTEMLNGASQELNKAL